MSFDVPPFPTRANTEPAVRDEPLPASRPHRGTTPAAAGNPAAENGAILLEDVAVFLGRFVAYPSEAAYVAHVLWIAHVHMMAAWESTPRIAFLSPEPGSGKTRALEVTELLVPNPVEAINVTPAYLFRKVGDPAGAPTILFDEVDTVFGPKAKDNEEIRGLLNAGHRRGAVAGRCVVKGRTVETEEIPAYCAVALAGLGGLPDTLLSRAVIVRMRRRAPTEVIEPFRHRVHAPQGHELRNQLAAWAATKAATAAAAWPDIPHGIADRDADVWEPLLAVADAAGDTWPNRARVAAVALVADSKRGTPSLGVRLLADLRDVFGDTDMMATEAILTALTELDESPWADLYGKPLNARGLAQRLRQYGVASTSVRIGDWHGKGYRREDLWDAWQRYLPETSGTPGTASPLVVPPVPHVPDPAAHGGSLDEPQRGSLYVPPPIPPRGIGEGEGNGVGPSPQEPGTSGTAGTPTLNLIDDLRQRPGRCTRCGRHVATQGHAPDCADDGSPDATAE